MEVNGGELRLPGTVSLYFSYSGICVLLNSAFSQGIKGQILFHSVASLNVVTHHLLTLKTETPKSRKWRRSQQPFVSQFFRNPSRMELDCTKHLVDAIESTGYQQLTLVYIHEGFYHCRKKKRRAMGSIGKEAYQEGGEKDRKY